MNNNIVDPARLAQKYIDAVREEISSDSLKIHVLGLIATKDKPSLAYAGATSLLEMLAEIGLTNGAQAAG